MEHACVQGSFGTIKLIKNGSVQNAAKMKGFLKERLQGLRDKYEIVRNIRGLSLA